MVAVQRRTRWIVVTPDDDECEWVERRVVVSVVVVLGIHDSTAAAVEIRFFPRHLFIVY